MDAAFYPHLFDLIFNAAPRASLLRLRSASRTLLKRVDEQLSRRIIILRDESSDEPEILTPEGRHPALFGWLDMYDADTLIYDDDALAPHEWFHPPEKHQEHTTRCYALRARRSRFLNAVQVVDIDGQVDPERVLELLTAIGHRVTLRLRNIIEESPCMPFLCWPREQTDELIVFSSLKQPIVSHWGREPIIDDYEDDEDEDEDEDADSHEQKLVFSFSGHGFLRLPDFPGIDTAERARGKISEIVAVFTGRESDGREDYAHFGPPRKQPQADNSGNTVNGSDGPYEPNEDVNDAADQQDRVTRDIKRWLEVGIDFTIVGADSMLIPHFWYDVEIGGYQWHPCAAKQMQWVQRVDLGGDPRRFIASTPGKLRLLTVDEYRASVSPSQFALRMGE